MRLSICVPTYNRASKLPRLLESIAEQADHQFSVEIVISDNASTDDTTDVVDRYRSAGLDITYQKLPKNLGFDRNILNAIAIASGDFCWFFGSDDFLEPGAFARLEQALNRHPGVTGISIGLQAYSPDLSRPVYINDHVSTDFSGETLLSGRENIIATVGACFGFMSSIVVRREPWLAAVARTDLKPYLIGYVHTCVIARMLNDQSEWIVLPVRLVGYRTTDEPFGSASEFARTRLDIVGFDLAFGDVLGRKNWAYRRAMAMVAKYAVSVHFRNAKLQGVSNSYWREAIPTTVAYFWRYPGFWTRTFPIALVPRRLLLGARGIFRLTIKRARERSMVRQLTSTSDR